MKITDFKRNKLKQTEIITSSTKINLKVADSKLYDKLNYGYSTFAMFNLVNQLGRDKSMQQHKRLRISQKTA